MSTVSSLNQVLTQLRKLPAASEPERATWEDVRRPFRVLTVTSNKGGVGKTTLATNLAVYFRALREDLPILLLGLDDQSLIDRMFALEPRPTEQTVLSAFRGGSLTRAIRLGQYGVHYLPSSPDVAQLKHEIDGAFHLQRVLLATCWRGLVVIDTKSDLEILTQNAIAASDLTLVPVEDHASLDEAQKVFDLLDTWEHSGARARVLLSLVDRRIKYSDAESRDILGLLVSEIRRRKLPMFESFISRSPKFQSLTTNPHGRAVSILHGATNSLVHRQMQHLASDVLAALGADGTENESTPEESEHWCNHTSRYRLGDGTPNSDDETLFGELEPRYREFFVAALDPAGRCEPVHETLRADLEREPVDRRCFDSLNALALAYFRMHAARLNPESRLGSLRLSLRSAKVCAELPGVYDKTADSRLRDAILDFFEDAARRERTSPRTASRRLAPLVESLGREESDPARIARIRSLRIQLARRGFASAA